MTDEQILMTAREVGWNTEHRATNDYIVRLARAIAEHEREECAQILDDALGTAMLAKAQKNADGSDAYDNAIIDAVCMALDQYSTDIRSRT